MKKLYERQPVSGNILSFISYYLLIRFNNLRAFHFTKWVCYLEPKSSKSVIVKIQLPLVISTPPISTLSLVSNRCLSPVYYSYISIVFQLRMSRTSFKSTLRLSRPSFSVRRYIFHLFYYRVSRTGIHDGKRKSEKKK